MGQLRPDAQSFAEFHRHFQRDIHRDLGCVRGAVGRRLHPGAATAPARRTACSGSTGCDEGQGRWHGGRARAFHLKPDVLRGRADRGHLRRAAPEPSHHPHAAQRQRGGDQRHALLRHPRFVQGRAVPARPNGRRRAPNGTRVDRHTHTRRVPITTPGASRRDRPAFRASASSRSARCARRCTPLDTCHSHGARADGRRRHGRGEGRLDRIPGVRSATTRQKPDQGARHARGGRQQIPGGLRRPPAREFPAPCWRTTAW